MCVSYICILDGGGGSASGINLRHGTAFQEIEWLKINMQILTRVCCGKWSGFVSQSCCS